MDYQSLTITIINSSNRELNHNTFLRQISLSATHFLTTATNFFNGGKPYFLHPSSLHYDLRLCRMSHFVMLVH